MEQGQLTNENLSQSDLTQEELVLLNNLMYIQDPDYKLNSDITNYKGDSIKSFVEKYSKNNYKKINDLPHGSTDTTHEEWKAMIKKIEQDDKLMNLKITDMKTDDKGGNAVCLENPDNPDKATVVFRGTGSYEWLDNGMGGYSSTLTDQQKEVVDWVNSLPYNQITSTGHSKGGNKSMIVALLCSKVVRCVALDGQGVSPEFCEKYIDEINENKDKITLICSQGDYVNGLFTNIAGNTVYTKSDENYCERLFSHILTNPIDLYFLKNDVIDIGREHCPTTLLNFENGQVSLRDISEDNQKDPIARLMHDYVVYVNDNARLEDREYLYALLMNMLQGKEQKIGVEFPDIFKDEKYLRKIIKFLFQGEEIGVSIECPDGFTKRIKKLYKDWVDSLNISEDQKEKFDDLFISYIFKELVWNMPLSEKEIKELNELISGIHVQGEVLQEISENSLIRDFSEATKESLINYIKDVEGDNPLLYKKWDQWNQLGEVQAMLAIGECEASIDKYYNHLVEKNNESIQKIDELFEKIYNKDKEYCGKLGDTCDKIQEVQQKIVNITQKFNTSKVSVDLLN